MVFDRGIIANLRYFVQEIHRYEGRVNSALEGGRVHIRRVCVQLGGERRVQVVDDGGRVGLVGVHTGDCGGQAQRVQLSDASVQFRQQDAQQVINSRCDRIKDLREDRSLTTKGSRNSRNGRGDSINNSSGDRPEERTVTREDIICDLNQSVEDLCDGTRGHGGQGSLYVDRGD